MSLKAWYRAHNMGEVLVWLFYSPVILCASLMYLLLLYVDGAAVMAAVLQYPVWVVWLGALLAGVSIVCSILLLGGALELYHDTVDGGE